MKNWFFILSVWVFLMPGNLLASQMETSAGRVQIEKIASGLEQPWSFGFLPDGTILITERDGGFLAVSPSGRKTKISGAPKVVATGQGGLLDALVPRDFARTRMICLSFVRAQADGEGTAVGCGHLSKKKDRLRDFKILFEMAPGSEGGRHFGGRLVEASNGDLFLTIGDRGDRKSAQDLSRHNGSVIRIKRNGKPAGAGISRNAPEIWSYGHRNPQGAALDLKGNLWLNEHGAKGGDEVNKVKKGANFGWPVISYGRHYSGAKIGEGTKKSGMEQSEHYWDPSIAPSGLMIYSGKLWPKWKGHFFVGSLKFDYIARLDPQRNFVEEALQSAETGRVRDVREGPDGAIWFLSVIEGALFRMTPEQ